jgi:(R,R)-butanediol dehydrogenase/meso-butanediol dehydrogenase/diacetyl reductase
MRAAMYYGNHKLEIEDIPEPTPDAGQVKVRVSRNGICGTDLHEYYDGPIFIPPDQPHPLTGKAMPLVIGHEFSGVVTEVGPGVTHVNERDRVAIEPIYRCGHCRPCKTGRYNLCNSVGFHGLMADGGMAEYTVVP